MVWPVVLYLHVNIHLICMTPIDGVSLMNYRANIFSFLREIIVGKTKFMYHVILLSTQIMTSMVQILALTYFVSLCRIPYLNNISHVNVNKIREATVFQIVIININNLNIIILMRVNNRKIYILNIIHIRHPICSLIIYLSIHFTENVTNIDRLTFKGKGRVKIKTSCTKNNLGFSMSFSGNQCIIYINKLNKLTPINQNAGSQLSTYLYCQL